MNKIFVLSIFVIIFFSFLRPIQAHASTYYIGCSGGNVTTSTGLSSASLTVGAPFDASAQISSTCTYSVTVNLSTNNNGGGNIGLIGNTIVGSGGYTGWYAQHYTAPGAPSSYNVHYITNVFNSQIFNYNGVVIVYGQCYNDPNLYDTYLEQDFALRNQWGANEAAPSNVTLSGYQLNNGVNEAFSMIIPAGQSTTGWIGYEDCYGNTLRFNNIVSATLADGTPVAVY